jgi:hypothetical protein
MEPEILYRFTSVISGDDVEGGVGHGDKISKVMECTKDRITIQIYDVQTNEKKIYGISMIRKNWYKKLMKIYTTCGNTLEYLSDTGIYNGRYSWNGGEIYSRDRILV